MFLCYIFHSAVGTYQHLIFNIILLLDIFRNDQFFSTHRNQFTC